MDWSSISMLQWVAFVFGVLYIVFAAYDKHQCWVYSIISTIALAIEDFVHLQLYFDSAVQVFYALVALCGLYVWIVGTVNPSRIRISTVSASHNILYIIIALMVALGLGYLMTHQSDAAYPYLDAFTSIIAILGTFLMVYHYIDSWYYLIFSSSACIYLYYMRGAPLVALLYAVYVVLAVIGLLKWHQKRQDQHLAN